MTTNKNFCVLFGIELSIDDCKQFDLHISGMNVSGGVHSFIVFTSIGAKSNKPYSLGKLSFISEVNEERLKTLIEKAKNDGFISKFAVDCQGINNIEAFDKSQKNNKIIYQRD